MNLITINDLGKLSEPITKLIEVTARATGVIFEPYQTVRMAKADAKANRIRSLAELDLEDELEQKTIQRLIHQEKRKHINIEQITLQAAQSLDDDAKPNDIDEDWLVDFFNKSETVSNKEMQSLWAKILAGEANQNGSFSKRTTTFVSSMSKEEAQLFTSLCQFCWGTKKESVFIDDYKNDIYTKAGITYQSLMELEALGLIHFFPNGHYTATINSKLFWPVYFNKSAPLQFPKDHGNQFKMGHVDLTKLGKELSPICDTEPNYEYLNHMASVWKKEGLWSVPHDSPNSKV
ncbi:MAG: DUF2806 domain-containing protein [Methylocystaceae bacterium]|nr:DUF2806 domain-containing protein [Methylocystaceae bacterium]